MKRQSFIVETGASIWRLRIYDIVVLNLSFVTENLNSIFEYCTMLRTLFRTHVYIYINVI